MSKFLLGLVASAAMVGSAIAADLPRAEPPPVVAAPVGKAPIGKFPLWQGAGRRAVLTGMDYP